MSRFWAGAAPAGVDVRFVPTPYLGVDLVGVGLVRLVGVEGAARLLTVAALALLPAGMYRLLAAVAPARRGWALAGVLLAFSWFLTAGMLNFAIGAGLALLWLAAWWPRRGRRGRVARLALAAAMVALFMTHMAVALTALVVVWTHMLVTARDRWRGRGGWRALLAAPEVGTAVLLAATVFAMMGWEAAAGRGTPAPPGAAGGLGFRPPGMKLAALGSPFYSFSLGQAALMAVAYAATLAAFVVAERRGRVRGAGGGWRRADTFTVASAAFLLLFLAFPREIGAASGLDVRWLVPLYVLVFCAGYRGAVRPPRWALGVAFAACLVNAASMWWWVRAFDRRLDDFDAALRAVPARARLLPLIADLRSFPRVGPYQQYALWHVVRRDGQVPGLFALSGVREGEPPFAHFQHFTVRERPFYPHIAWGTRDFRPLDWARIGREYDYLVVVADEPRVAGYVAAHAREVARVGAVHVYRVTPAAAE